MLAGERERVRRARRRATGGAPPRPGAAPAPRSARRREPRADAGVPGSELRRARPARSRSTRDPGPRAPAEPGRAARARRRSRSAPRTTPLPKPRAARGRRAFPTGPARSTRPGTTLRPIRRASSLRRARPAPRRSPRRSARSERWTPRGGGAAAPSPGTATPNRASRRGRRPAAGPVRRRPRGPAPAPRAGADGEHRGDPPTVPGSAAATAAMTRARPAPIG